MAGIDASQPPPPDAPPAYVVEHFKYLWAPLDTERALYDKLLAAWFAMAPIMYVACMCFTAPYGRHYRGGFGPKINGRVGWFVQEVISPICFWLGFFSEIPVGKGLRFRLSTRIGLPFVFFAMWMIHYGNRSFIHSLMCPSFGPTNLATVLLASLFNVANGYLNGRHFSLIQPYTTDWFFDVRFIAGIALWNAGWLINIVSDHALWALRSKRQAPAPPAADKPAPPPAPAAKGGARGRKAAKGKAEVPTGGPKEEERKKEDEAVEVGAEGEGKRPYLVPRGGAFEYVSCANYFGELLEWTGYALATWSPAALAFALLTAANLIPRARAHHAFYRSHFGDKYPARRTAIIPLLY